jgi:hypothetical protein
MGKRIKVALCAALVVTVLCAGTLSARQLQTARSYRRLQRTLQRHPTMQGRVLLRAYKWSNPRIVCFRSAISKTGLKKGFAPHSAF